jgi:hypothetical protein
MEDRSAADELLAAVLLTAPRLGQTRIDALTRLVDVAALHGMEDGERALVALGLLGPRVPHESIKSVVWAIQRVLNKHREALEVGAIPEELRQADARSLLRLALVSLFAQRTLGALPCTDINLTQLRRILLEECRQSFFALEGAIRDGELPQLQEYHQMLLTTFVVDPTTYPPATSALLRMLFRLRDDAPVLAHTLSKLLWAKGFRSYLLNAREQFDPDRAGTAILFAGAVMETTMRVEFGEKILGEADAELCHGDFSELLKRIKDPYLAFYVSEFQRVLTERFAVLQSAEGR